MTNYSLPLDTVFHALADPTRRAVVRRLGRGDAAVTDLAAPFDMALSSFMKHLRVLEEGGLVRSEKAGRVRTCALVPEAFSLAQTWMDEQRSLWEGRTDHLAAYVETLAAKEMEK